MRLKNKKGSVLITLIVAMVLMAFLGLGIYGLFTSSAFSELLSNRNDNAYQLAKAGIRFAADTNGTALGDFLMPDNSKKFNLVKNGNQITSTGIVNAGTFLEARRVLKYTILGIPDPRISDLPQKNKTVGTPGSIANDGTTITLGGTTSPGVSQSYGAIWYNGNNASGNCSAGACSFNLGLRAYFEFQFPNDNNSGDGFTFAIMSTLTNTNDRTGGFSKTQYPGSYTRSDGTTTSVAGGELMGYAGPGNTDGSATSVASDRQGLRPPKMAVEFDTYTNIWPSAPNTPVYLAMTRNDPTLGTYGDHLALMFWGDDSTTGSGSVTLKNSAGNNITLPLSSFDDNRHGVPTTTYRQNGLGKIGYDMEDGLLRSCRIEITRPTSAVTSGTYAGYYQYLITVWVEQTSTLSAVTKSRLQDVFVPYTDTTAKIYNAAAYFTPTEHNNFANIFWGFTEGTGDKVQQVALTNTIVFFPNTASTCRYPTSPASPVNYPSTDGPPGSIALTTTSDCYWAVQSLTPLWIHITSTPLYGKGNGTISYTVDDNAGPVRIGYINIAGQTFQVNQASGCSYTVAGVNTSTYTAGGGNDTYSVTTGSGCPWTASNNGNTWITVTPANAAGSGSGTITVAANTGIARTGTITIAGQDFTVTQASGCSYAVGSVTTSYAAGGGNDTYTVTTSNSNCPWTASNNGNTWITVTPANAAGSGSGTITVAANTGIARTGTITIAGRTFTVTQNSGCTYTFGSCPSAFPVTGGTGSISVTTATGCTWTSSDTVVGWISTSPLSSSDSGSVTVTVNAYTGTSYTTSRTGTVTVSGTMGTSTHIDCTISENRR